MKGWCFSGGCRMCGKTGRSQATTPQSWWNKIPLPKFATVELSAGQGSYSTVELPADPVSFAQTTYELQADSVHRDLQYHEVPKRVTRDLSLAADKSIESSSRKVHEVMEHKTNKQAVEDPSAYTRLVGPLAVEKGATSERIAMLETASESLQQIVSTTSNFRQASITADTTLVKPSRPPPIPPRPVKKTKASGAIIRLTSPEGSTTMLNLDLSSSSLDLPLTGFVPLHDDEPEEPKRESPNPPKRTSAQGESHEAEGSPKSPCIPLSVTTTEIKLSKETRTHANVTPKVPPRPSRYRQREISRTTTDPEESKPKPAPPKEGKIIAQESTTNHECQGQPLPCEQDSQSSEDEDSPGLSGHNESAPLLISNFTFSSPAFATLNDVVHPPQYTEYIPPVTLEGCANDPANPVIISRPKISSSISDDRASRPTLPPRPSESRSSSVEPLPTSPRLPIVSPEVVPSYCRSDQQVAVSPPTRSFKFPRLRPSLALQPRPLQSQYSLPPQPQSSNIQSPSRPQVSSNHNHSPSWPSSPQRVPPASPPFSSSGPLPKRQSFAPQIPVPNLTQYQRIDLTQRQSIQSQSTSPTPRQPPTSNILLSPEQISEYAGAFAPPAPLPKPKPKMEPVRYYYA